MKRIVASSLKVWVIAGVGASSLTLAATHAQAQSPIKTVWYILMENRNWSSGAPSDSTGGPVLLGNSAAPNINSFVDPTKSASEQVSYCSCYHHVLATPTGANPSIHPSEPNYIWMEAGSNLSKLDDNDPYGSGNSTLQIYNYLAANPSQTAENVCGLLQAAGISWKSYQEDTDLLTTAGNNVNVTPGSNDLTNTVAPASLWSVPLQSFSGTATGHYKNPYNLSAQYAFACKHNGSLFFVPTNGGTITTANYANTNPETFHYAPLEQLATDLTNGTCAAYNVITPDLFNDMHTALSAGVTYYGVHYTGALAQVAQGDKFLAVVIPKIKASPQYRAGGMIVIWTDETEGSNQNDFNHTLMEIVISGYAKGRAYNSTLNYTHSSDIATLQKIFGVVANSPTGYLGDAANLSNSSGVYEGVGTGQGTYGFGTGGPFGGGQARDLSDLFKANTIPLAFPALQTSASAFTIDQVAGTATQTVTVTNDSASAIAVPVYLEVANLNTTLTNQSGTTTTFKPIGSPYITVSASGLPAGGSASIALQFTLPASPAGILENLSAISTAGTP